jgi:hypothetical protein
VASGYIGERACLSAFQCIFNGQFAIQNGVGTCERDASPHPDRIKKNDPFPATWIDRLNDFVLNTFVFHRLPQIVKRLNFYPNANRSEAETPAARRLARAASVQSGRAVRVARPTTTFAKAAILNSPALGSKSIQISKAVACQFVRVAFAGPPFAA